METVLEEIGECGHDLTTAGRHAVRVDGVLQPTRGYYRGAGGFLICSDCWAGDRADVNERLNRFNYGHGNQFFGLYGGWDSTGVLPCESCGLPVERGSNPRTKSHTCSRACTVRLSKAKTVSVAVTERACPICGGLIDGRADRRYCSDRCRQHAHRHRHVPPERDQAASAAMETAMAEIHQLINTRPAP